MADSLSPAAYRQAFGRVAGGSGGGGGGSSGGGGGGSGGSSGGFAGGARRQLREAGQDTADGGDAGPTDQDREREREARRTVREAGRDESGAGGGEDAVDADTDPERGDETTRVAKPGQDSDPMSEQTVESPNPRDAQRETRRTLREAGGSTELGDDPADSLTESERQARRTLREAGRDTDSDPATLETGADRTPQTPAADDELSPDEVMDSRREARRTVREAGGTQGQGLEETEPDLAEAEERIVDEAETDFERETRRFFRGDRETPPAEPPGREDIAIVQGDDGFQVVQTTEAEVTAANRRLERGGALRERVLEDIDRQLEQTVGEQRARSLGMSPSLLTDENLRDLADLERGEDYTVEFETTETAEGIRVSVDTELTPETREDLTREFAERRVETDVALDQGTFVDIDPQEDIRVEDGSATVTESGVEKIAEPAVETQVGEARARSLGISPSLLDDRSARQLADVEPGIDFTVSGTDVELTERFEEDLAREFAERGFETQLALQGRQVDLDREEDISVSREFDDREVRRFFRGDRETAPEEQISATLSESGEQTIQAAGRREDFGDTDVRIPTSVNLEALSDVDPEGVFAAAAAPGARDYSGPQVIETSRVDDVLGGVQQTGVELMDTASDIAALGTSSPVEQVQRSKALADELAERDLEGTSITDLSAAELADITLETSERLQEQSPAARYRAGAGTGIAAIPAAPLTLPKAALEFAELQAYSAEEIEAGRGQELSEDIGAAAVESVSGAVEYARENPVRVSGMGAGSLLASTATMGAAAAVSSRAGLASRVAIQPGEELLGYGGSAAFSGTARGLGGASRALPEGRAARATARAARGAERGGDILFPRNEPLIFSEEAAIYGAQRLGGAVRRGGGRARSRLADVALGEAETTVDTSPSSFDGFQNVGPIRTERPGLRSRMGDLADAVAEDFRGTDRGQAQLPIGRAETETEDPRTITEDDILPPRAEPDQGPFFDPTTRELRREAGESPSNLAREASRPRVEVEQETSRRARRRAESALDVGSLGFEGLGMDTLAIGETRTRADTIGRADIITDTEIETDTRTETELAQELRLEIRTDVETRAEVEAEAEAEFEFEFESEFDNELEIEGNRDRDAPDRRRRRENPLAPWVERVQFSGIDPLSGA